MSAVFCTVYLSFLQGVRFLAGGKLRYSNSELTEIVDFRAVFLVLGETRIILRGILVKVEILGSCQDVRKRAQHMLPRRGSGPD